MTGTVCGYQGEAVCFPPDCSGACPVNGVDTRPARDGKEGRMSGTSPWQCTCGYQAESQQDLDEHTGAMAPLEEEGKHQQKTTR